MTLSPRILSDEFGLELVRLQPKRGDVLVLTFDHTPSHDEATRTAEALRNALYGMNVDDTLTLVLTPGSTLEALDEDAMKGYGWVRAPRGDFSGKNLKTSVTPVD